MARLTLTQHPHLPAGADYEHYKDWLLNNFYHHLCSYCLLQHEGLQIEHYEPKQFAPARVCDPTNLLLACSRCNLGKSDYHHAYAERRRARHEHHGYAVIDVRSDDLATLYDLTPDGLLFPRVGVHQQRAEWNIVLLKLDVKFIVEKRAECLRILATCERLLAAHLEGNEEAQQILDVLIEPCAQQYLLFKAFDMPVSDGLRERIEGYVRLHRPELVVT